MAIQSAAKATMRTFLNSVYYIPRNQREYTWDSGNLEDFWMDLESLLRHSESMHFFGQIVIYNDTATKKKYIIDGQQRTVTSMLFLRAMQYYCETLRGNPLTDAQKTELDNIDYSIKQCLGRPSTQYDSDVQLHLNFENEIAINDYFQNKIIKGAPTSKKETDEPARENMRAAYYYFYDKLQEN